MLETIKGPQGDIWFVVDGKTVLYIDSNGTLNVNGDVIAFNKNLPTPPTKK